MNTLPVDGMVNILPAIHKEARAYIRVQRHQYANMRSSFLAWEICNLFWHRNLAKVLEFSVLTSLLRAHNYQFGRYSRVWSLELITNKRREWPSTELHRQGFLHLYNYPLIRHSWLSLNHHPTDTHSPPIGQSRITWQDRAILLVRHISHEPRRCDIIYLSLDWIWAQWSPRVWTWCKSCRQVTSGSVACCRIKPGLTLETCKCELESY